MFNQISVGRFVVKLTPSEEVYVGAKILREQYGLEFLLDHDDLISWGEISHDYLHFITNIPPTQKGEEELAELTYFIYEGEAGIDLLIKLEEADDDAGLETYKRLYALGI
jgi:hypothetical protein